MWESDPVVIISPPKSLYNLSMLDDGVKSFNPYLKQDVLISIPFPLFIASFNIASMIS